MVTGAKQLGTLKEASAKPRNFLVKTMPDIAVLRDISTKNGDARREAKHGHLRLGGSWVK